MLIVAVFLAVLGACAGSFASALTWRIHEQAGRKKDKRLSILTGRSMCPHCHHRLVARDLVPVLSWLSLRGRCRYCQKPIPASYLLVELAGVVVFAGSYLLWPVDLGTKSAKFALVSWLIVAVGLLALALYDARWRQLPNRIIYPTFLLAASLRLAYILAYEPDPRRAFGQWVLSVAIAGGIFWLIYQFSAGKWIGFGDVRLGWITGTALAAADKSFIMLFGASLLATLVVLPSLAAGKSSLKTKISFGPFLITATWLSLLFGQSLTNWYHRFLS